MGLTRKSKVTTSESHNVGNPVVDFTTLRPADFPTRKVALFIDIFAAYNDPLIAAAAVAVLQHNGIEVYVPPRQVGCGAAALSRGDLDSARESAPYAALTIRFPPRRK